MQAQEAAPGFCQTLTSIWVAIQMACTAQKSHERFPKLHSAFRESETGIVPQSQLIIKGLGTPCYPPFTQSSSHLIPPGRLDQEKPSADLLQIIFVFLLVHDTTNISYQYFGYIAIAKSIGMRTPHLVPVSDTQRPRLNPEEGRYHLPGRSLFVEGMKSLDYSLRKILISSCRWFSGLLVFVV